MRTLRSLRVRLGLCAALAVPALGALPAFPAPSFFDPLPDGELADALIEAMTDEELLSQVFFIGYPDTEPSAFVKDWIRSSNLGGVKLFSWNVGDLTSLASSVRALQSLALGHRLGIPLLVAADQEGGGWVQNIREGCTVTPGNMAIAASGLPRDALDTGYHVGRELRVLGINMNFAPAVDVLRSAEAAVIGPRAFSSDPEQVGLLSLAFFRGQSRAGVICTAKHFPGHGAADEDSHGFLPQVETTLEELWETDLLPYRLLIAEDIPAIMGGHLAYPKIIGPDVPATLSDYMLVELLRNRLGFGGVLITDDFKMYGIHQGKMDMATVSRHALEAGNDMILLTRTRIYQERAWNLLIGLLKVDDGFRHRIVEAVRRVLLLKLHWLKRDFPLLPDVQAVAREIPSPEASEFSLNSSCRAVTVIAAEDLPLKPSEHDRILLVGQADHFFEAGRARLPRAAVYDFPFYPMEWSRAVDRQRLPRIAAEYDVVIFCLTSRNSLEVLSSLEDYPGHLYVISALAPVHVASVPWVRTVLAVYGLGRDSFRAGFGALLGDFEAEGRLPIRELISFTADEG